REEDDVADAILVGEEHHETLNTAAKAAGGRHANLKRLKVVLVEHLCLVVAALALARLVFEAGALIQWVIELGEALAQLEAARVGLEALDDAGVARLALGQGQEIGRIVINKCRSLDTGLWTLEHDALQVVYEPAACEFRVHLVAAGPHGGGQ